MQSNCMYREFWVTWILISGNWLLSWSLSVRHIDTFLAQLWLIRIWKLVSPAVTCISRAGSRVLRMKTAIFSCRVFCLSCLCFVCLSGRDPCFLLVLTKTVLKPEDRGFVAFHLILNRWVHYLLEIITNAVIELVTITNCRKRASNLQKALLTPCVRHVSWICVCRICLCTFTDVFHFTSLSSSWVWQLKRFFGKRFFADLKEGKLSPNTVSRVCSMRSQNQCLRQTSRHQISLIVTSKQTNCEGLWFTVNITKIINELQYNPGDKISPKSVRTLSWVMTCVTNDTRDDLFESLPFVFPVTAIFTLD